MLDGRFQIRRLERSFFRSSLSLAEYLLCKLVVLRNCLTSGQSEPSEKQCDQTPGLVHSH